MREAPSRGAYLWQATLSRGGSGSWFCLAANGLTRIRTYTERVKRMVGRVLIGNQVPDYGPYHPATP